MRVDKYLETKGYFESREKAKAAVLGGCVFVNNKVITKPSYEVGDKDQVYLDETKVMPYVSRGALKLKKALDVFNINPTNLCCLDIGSSTGGFIDVLLNYGAKKVYGVDTGTGILHKKLIKDSRVEVFEGTDFRNLDKFDNISLITIDVSFISLEKFIENLKKYYSKAKIIALIKPQFECGYEAAKKYRGVIKDPKIHIKVIEKIFRLFKENDFNLSALTFSPITGGDGNIEYLALFNNGNCSNLSIEQTVLDAFNSFKN